MASFRLIPSVLVNLTDLEMGAKVTRVAGVVSFGFGCGRRNLPGGYMDVSKFNSWIQECLVSDVLDEDQPEE